MARMSVYISDDMKARIDALPELNWSRVAQHAFAAKLKQFEVLTMKKIEAPWTDEQVAALNRWQHHSCVHEFTCPGDRTCPDRALIATNDGWVCACGEYRQTWAYSVMAGRQ